MNASRTAELFEAFAARSLDDAREIGKQLAAQGGFKLMADEIDRLEEDTGDVRVAAWISRRWAGIEYARGRFWA